MSSRTGRPVRPKPREFWQGYSQSPLGESVSSESVSTTTTTTTGPSPFPVDFRDSASFNEYRRCLLAQLDVGAAQQSFKEEARVKAGWRVEPCLPPSPRAAQRGFAIAQHTVKWAVVAPKVAVIDAVDLTVSSDGDMDGEPSAPPPATRRHSYTGRIKEALARIGGTPVYDALRGRHDRAIASWIGQEERGRLAALGYMLPDSPAWPALPPAALRAVQEAWRLPSREDAPLSEIGPIPITADDLRRMRGTTWLNDECINGFLQLVQEGHPDIHVFSTFFYPALNKQGYSAVQRWTRRFDLFSKRLVLIPVHLGMHWTMACIDFPQRRIAYLDSFHAGNNACLRDLRAYLEAEHRDKKAGREWDSSGWTCTALTQGIPEQRNGYDCGVFTCLFGECLATGRPLSFTQRDMPYFRHRIAYELLTAQRFPS